MIALTPRQKLGAAAALSLVLALAAALPRGSITGVVRVGAAATVVCGLMIWLLRHGGRVLPGHFARTQRLQLIQKLGLSARTGLALVEVDGRAFLIVHGDGPPRIRRVASRAAMMAGRTTEASS